MNAMSSSKLGKQLVALCISSDAGCTSLMDWFMAASAARTRRRFALPRDEARNLRSRSPRRIRETH